MLDRDVGAREDEARRVARQQVDERLGMRLHPDEDEQRRRRNRDSLLGLDRLQLDRAHFSVALHALDFAVANHFDIRRGVDAIDEVL